MRLRMIIIVCAAILMVGTVSHAAVPASITVQGKLTDSVGTPLPSGSKSFTFRIFDDTLGGLQIWPPTGVEFQSINSDAAGLWTAIVGKVSPLTDPVFISEFRWLEISVNGVFLPLVRIATGPYAFRVATVDGASGGTITSKVSIGQGHVNTGVDAFVAGSANEASGDNSTIGGGLSNTASGTRSTVAGGKNNAATALIATVSGGEDNTAGGPSSAVAGGYSNAAIEIDATIGGGFSNHATGKYSTIAGGTYNRAHGIGSAVGGGGTVLIADSNVAGGLCATVPGGRNNYANGNYSFAAGRRAQALHAGTFVWSDSTNADFTSTAINQFLIRASGGVGIGTNAPEGPLHVFRGSAGTVTANVGSTVVLEDDASHYLALLSPDDTERGILFGSPANNVMGGIRFNVSTTRKGMHFRTGNNLIRLILDSLGTLTADGCIVGSNIACPSDARFKRSIETLPNALDRVAQLRGVSYEWDREKFADREFPAGLQMGLIAQEVREVVPQAVIEQSDGYLAVDYARLVPLLIESIKEHQKRIEALEKILDQHTP